MNDLFYPEDIIETVRMFLRLYGDVHDRDLIISFAAELLDISEENVWEWLY